MTSVYRPIPDHPDALEFYDGPCKGGALLSLVLSRSVTNYACAPLRALDYSDFPRVVQHTADYIAYLLKRMEQQQPPCTVQRFVIGKTFLSNATLGEALPADPRTWGLKGLSSRWHTKYRNEGYQGLVALLAIRKDQLPSALGAAWRTPEGYSLALEQALITHFAYGLKDPRLANESLLSGRYSTKDTVDTFVVYVAIATTPVHPKEEDTALALFQQLSV